MGKVIEVIMVIVDYGKFFVKHSNEYLIMAEILFYGLVQFIRWGAPKLIAFIVTKLFAVLFVLKKLIEKFFDFLFSKLAESTFVEKVKTHYLSKINTNGMSFGDFFVALFQGVAGAVAS